ncbi:MAG: hypothetical protein ACTSQE_11975 [Candidatus Heimdallarchaeaceae archaeon]
MTDKESKSKEEQEDRDSSLPCSYKYILDQLPFAISIQKIDTQEIIYENNILKELVGSFLHQPCYRRWTYIPNWGNDTCVDCTLELLKKDGKKHRIFRKTVNREGQEVFFEIELVPLDYRNKKGELTHYMEILKPIDIDVKTEILTSQTIKEIISGLQFAIVQFGIYGADLVVTEELPFIKSIPLCEFLSKLTAYVFTGIFQGVEQRKGLFGPLPVLDRTDLLMHAFVFRVLNKEVIDKRIGDFEPCMLFAFYPREYYFLFENRKKIEQFKTKEIEQIPSLQEINNSFLYSLSAKIKDYIQSFFT